MLKMELFFKIFENGVELRYSIMFFSLFYYYRIFRHSVHTKKVSCSTLIPRNMVELSMCSEQQQQKIYTHIKWWECAFFSHALCSSFHSFFHCMESKEDFETKSSAHSEQQIWNQSSLWYDAVFVPYTVAKKTWAICILPLWRDSKRNKKELKCIQLRLPVPFCLSSANLISGTIKNIFLHVAVVFLVAAVYFFFLLTGMLRGHSIKITILALALCCKPECREWKENKQENVE